MIFYFGIFGFFFLCSLLEVYAIQKKEAYLIFFHLAFFCFLLATFKARGLGTDSSAYEQYFYTRKSFFQPTDMEWLFSRLVEFVRIVFINYTVLLAILSFFLYKFEILIIKKWSVYPITSLFYMWATCCNYVFFVRQIVAMFIIVYAVRYINENRKWRFIITVLIASLIHISSVFFIIAWFIWKIRFTKKQYLILFIIFSFIFPGVLKFLIPRIISIVHFPRIIQHRINIYFINPDQRFQHNFLILIKGLINQAFLLILIFFNYSKLENNQKDFKGWFNLVWFGGIIYCTTIQIHIQLARFSYPYMVGYMILYPSLIKTLCKDKKFGFLFHILLTLYIFLRYFVYLRQNATIIPYEIYMGTGDLYY